MQRPDVFTARQDPIGGGGGLERTLGKERHDRVDRRIDALDLGEMGLHHVDRTEVSLADGPSQFARGHED